MTDTFDNFDDDANAELAGIIPAGNLSLLGLGDIAYVRPVTDAGESGFGVFAADGAPLAMFDERDVAFAAARQNDLVPFSVH